MAPARKKSTANSASTAVQSSEGQVVPSEDLTMPTEDPVNKLYEDKMDSVSSTVPPKKAWSKGLPPLSIISPEGLLAKTPLDQLTQDELPRELFRERIAEQRQRRHFRVLMFWSFMILLVGQYAGLAALIYYAAAASFIDKIQPLLGVIIPATLGETYAIIRVMVNFVFSPGDFSNKDGTPKA